MAITREQFNKLKKGDSVAIHVGTPGEKIVHVEQILYSFCLVVSQGETIAVHRDNITIHE